MDAIGAPAASWLDHLPRALPWLAPAASVVHVIALVVLLSAILAFDITILGLDPGMDPKQAGRVLLPVARSAFAIQATSGLFLFLTTAPTMAIQPVFWTKLALVALALLNVGFFHKRAGPGMAALPKGSAPAWARTSAVLSLSAWSAITVAGCFLNYP